MEQIVNQIWLEAFNIFSSEVKHKASNVFEQLGLGDMFKDLDKKDENEL